MPQARRLRQTHDGLQVRDGFALGDGPYHFFDKSSRSAAASSICSASSFFSLAFSVLELPQPLGIGDVQTAELRLPIVQRRFRDAMLPRQIGSPRTCLMLTQHANNLASSVRPSDDVPPPN